MRQFNALCKTAKFILNIWILLYFLFLLLFLNFSKKISAKTYNLCDFPMPDNLEFSRICQFDYHQLSYLCDPSGMMSRTETELLDHHIKRVLHNNISGCICSTSKTVKNYNQFKNTKKLNAVIKNRCIDKHKEKHFLKVATILVPYNTFKNVQRCLQNQFSQNKNFFNEPYNFSQKAIIFARQLFKKWINARVLDYQTKTKLVVVCKDIDIFLVYIEHRLPNNILQPFVAHIYKNQLKQYHNLEFSHDIKENVSPFQTILSELTSAIKIFKKIQNNKQNPNNRLSFDNFSLSFKNDLVENKTNNVSGVPLWAYLLALILILVVLITVYFGNCVSRRLTQQKKHTTSAFKQGQNQSINANSERYKVGFGGGFIMRSGGMSTTANNSQSSRTLSKTNSLTKKQLTSSCKKLTLGRNNVIQKI